MRINRVQNCAAFGQLQPRVRYPYYINESRIKICEKKLADTKFVDVILDSHGFAIKEKMTDILHRIQSFSLFPQENAVGIRMTGEKEPIYKFQYKTTEEARSEWESLIAQNSLNGLEAYTNVALWLDSRLG